MRQPDARSAASVFDPARLRIARQAATLNKKDLAERVGVSPASISHYENGTTRPSAPTVASLALALGVPVGFFASDRPLGEAPATTAHFRSLRSTSKRERDRAFAHALLTWEFSQILERYVRLPECDLPSDITVNTDRPFSDVEAAARRAREFFRLGTGPVPNVIRLLESRGVVCTRLPAQTRRVFAFSCSFPERPVVVLSSERTHLAAGRFDATHELAHMVLHHDEEPGTHVVERHANTFAAEFLAPASELADLLPRRADWSELLHLKHVWGVSIQALLYRARSLGVMSEHTYRRAVTELNGRGWRRTEPGDEGRAEQPVLLARAVEAAAKHGLDLDDLVTASRLPMATVELIVASDDRPQVELESSSRRADV